MPLYNPIPRGWLLNGNSSTSSTNNFIGTRDAVDLSFRVNNVQRMLLTPSELQVVFPTIRRQDSSAGAAGSSFSFRSGASGAGTDLNGGNLTLASGSATGSGSSIVLINAVQSGGASGTTVRLPIAILSAGATQTAAVYTIAPFNNIEGVLTTGDGQLRIEARANYNTILESAGAGSLNLGSDSARTNTINIGALGRQVRTTGRNISVPVSLTTSVTLSNASVNCRYLLNSATAFTVTLASASLVEGEVIDFINASSTTHTISYNGGTLYSVAVGEFVSFVATNTTTWLAMTSNTKFGGVNAIAPTELISTLTSAATLSINTHRFVLANAAAGAFTLTLPTAINNAGAKLDIKRINATNNVTIATQASQTIDGVATKVLTSQYQSLTFISNGANWFLF